METSREPLSIENAVREADVLNSTLYLVHLGIGDDTFKSDLVKTLHDISERLDLVVVSLKAYLSKAVQ